jgi:hypothetical protein
MAGFSVYAKARPFENPGGSGVDGPGGSRLQFWRCGRAWSIGGSTHENLTAKEVETIRAEPALEGVLVFDEGAVDVDLAWDEID